MPSRLDEVVPADQVLDDDSAHDCPEHDYRDGVRRAGQRGKDPGRVERYPDGGRVGDEYEEDRD
jgi:hypothetical protein